MLRALNDGGDNEDIAMVGIMKTLLFAVCAFGIFGSAYAALAFLVESEYGTSVTGFPVWICTYEYNGQRFQKVIPISEGVCPLSIDIQ